ncbi:MAG: AAA family ATPase [Burkholderiales bacterium]
MLLSGEPGIGKSRILSALVERLQPQAFTAMQLQCSSYHVNSAFYPLIDNFERALKFGRDETLAARLDKLEALIVTHYGRPLADVRFIATMLSIPCEERYGSLAMTPQKQKDETLRSLVDVTEAAARKQPTVMLFEDAHWADPTTLEVLDLLIDRVRAIPLLIVLTHRPEFQPKWGSHGHVTALNLSKLTRAQSRAIISKLARGKALPADLLERILAKTDGVPLYVEELSKAILESGELKDAGDHYEYVGDARTITIPATLRDSLMARLDRFPAAKEIAQIGAAIGREFSYELIAAVVQHTRTELDSALNQLTESGLAFRRGTPPDTAYTFKHALVQDAAYDSLLKSRRQALHAKIARVLEEHFPATKDTEPELLAHHHTSAGEFDVAIPLWIKAANRASSRSSYREALTHVNSSAELLLDRPAGRERLQLELQLHLLRATALLATKGMSAVETGESFKAAWKLCAQLEEDSSDVVRSLYGMYAFHTVCGEYNESIEVARELQNRFSRSNDSLPRGLALRMIGATLLQRGDVKGSIDHLTESLALHDPERDRACASVHGMDFKAPCLSYLAQALWVSGSADRAIQASSEAVKHATALQHDHTLAHALQWLSYLHLLRGEYSLALDNSRQLMQLANQQQFAMWRGYARANEGVALIHLGYANEGAGQVVKFIHESERVGTRFNRTFHLAALADGMIRANRWEEAENRLSEAARHIETMGECWYEPEILRINGDYHLARRGCEGKPAAEGCFQTSLRIAREQQAKSWELRTSTSLAKLWQSQGKISEARALLEPVYGWFTEGFGTKDLKDAKALLDELAR